MKINVVIVIVHKGEVKINVVIVIVQVGEVKIYVAARRSGKMKDRMNLTLSPNFIYWNKGPHKVVNPSLPDFDNDLVHVFYRAEPREGQGGSSPIKR